LCRNQAGGYGGVDVRPAQAFNDQGAEYGAQGKFNPELQAVGMRRPEIIAKPDW